MNSLKFLWQKHAPIRLQNFINLYTDSSLNKIRRKLVLKQFNNYNINNQPQEIKEALKFLEKHRFTYFPYYWALKYDKYVPEVLFDSENKFHYILFENKKLYFPKKYNQNQVIWTVRGILKEQDLNSPHLYLTENFQIENDSILIDAGVAEGSFSLSAIEKVKKLYLIECEPEWLEALKITFAPWKDKVVIVGKYLSDVVSDNSVSIDNILEIDENEKYFVKFDIEGYEKQALEGMKNFFAKVKNLKMSVAAYHNLNDANDINKILSNEGLKCNFSESYLLFNNGNEIPNFRKAIIRAEK